MAKSKQKVPESGVLRACLDLLAAEGIWHRRWNTGAVKTGNRFFRFGRPGDADILFVIPQEYCSSKNWLDVRHQMVGWIECKSNSGQQTLEQANFHVSVEEQGHFYLVIRDVSDLQIFLKQNNLRGEVKANGQ